MTNTLERTRPGDYSVWDNFNPQKRAHQSELDMAVNALAAHPMVVAILESANVSMVVVNEQMQIVTANRVMWENLGEKSAESLLGKRIGEAVCCVNADMEQGGCSGSENCRSCGTSRHILTSQQLGKPSQGECLLVMTGEKTQHTSEFNIRATPVLIEGSPFTVVALQDISDSKRRRVLERVFVHDLNNTLTGLMGWSEHLSDTSGEDEEAEAVMTIQKLTRRLGAEVEYYRTLLSVEAGEFKPVPKAVSVRGILENVLNVFSKHHVAKSKNLELIDPIADVTFASDPAILERVLINMVKNALEATRENGTVRVGCTADEHNCFFSVWNDSSIPTEISARVFQRSFSTKADMGRGIGTYSMKLFGEKVLGGRVWFESSEKKGTTFHLDLPITAPLDGQRAN